MRGVPGGEGGNSLDGEEMNQQGCDPCGWNRMYGKCTLMALEANIAPLCQVPESLPAVTVACTHPLRVLRAGEPQGSLPGLWFWENYPK